VAGESGMKTLRIGMGQINTTVGDFDGNTNKILETIVEAKSIGVDLLTFPELAITGYPPEDLLFRKEFINKNLQCIEKIIENSSEIGIVVGFVDMKENIYNAAAIIYDGELVGAYHKVDLPNYGVFDEKRYFRAGSECPVFVIYGVGIGVNICEDIWYETSLTTAQAYIGAEVIVNISASPYHSGKGELRERMLRTRATDNVAIVAFNNLVGGQDELVFDGNSMVFNEKGQLIAEGKQFQEDLVIVDLDIDAVFQTRLSDSRWTEKKVFRERKEWLTARSKKPEIQSSSEKPPIPARKIESLSFPGDVYAALVLGTHDYITKNGFQKVVLGISGGIDSTLVAVIAADAIGASNVVGVTMPSRYSSTGSLEDARLLSANLGIDLINTPIESIFQSYLDTLNEQFLKTQSDLTEENIQARIRGNIVMALSNKFGWLVLTTGNKSEIATGYTTLYGDMSGGFAVIKDVPKTLVYKLAEYRNAMTNTAVIPARILTKAPSAELRPDQKDSDSLPSYNVLDPILKAYIEEDKSVEQIIDMGFDEAAVTKAASLTDISEYKRRQAPPGVKITPRAFGRDRRLPITNRFGNTTKK
jgi:NAD+ synthase (glutamine-hydrolysing)